MPSISDQSGNAAAFSPKMQRGERVIIYALLALTLLLKLIFVFRQDFDSDEPQHLHVVWGWAHGLLQYRDLFDNHSPLFQMLCAPLLHIIGESPGTLFAMRLAMVPLYIIVLWCTYLIGREVFSERHGLWAAVFTGLFPLFFLCSTEFRTDDLWAVFWMLSIAMLIRGHLTATRCFCAGLFLGAAMGVSMKTTLLLASLAAGALATIVFFPSRYASKPALGKLCRCSTALLAGLCIVPAALVFFFYLNDALGPLFYETIQHNIFEGMQSRRTHVERALFFLVLSALLFLLPRIIRNKIALTSDRQLRYIFIFFIGSIYFTALYKFWPILELEHFPPFFPLFFLMVTPLVLELPIKRILILLPSEQIKSVPGWTVAAFAVIIEIGLLCGFPDKAPWRDETLVEINLLKDVLKLTVPGDFVADLKGETIFRPRSSYYVLEVITRKRIRKGLLPDDIPERLLATRTCVALLDDPRFPERARAFLNENYIPVGSLRVAGKLLPQLSDTQQAISFNVLISVPYVIVSRNGPTAGLLDGKPYDGGECFLQAGQHEFRPASQNDTFALIWAKAHKHGYSPFS